MFISPRVEAGQNTPTVALRVEEGDEKENRCRGVQLGHPVTGGYKYRDLVLQVGGWAQGWPCSVENKKFWEELIAYFP
jgi:hypothetical protein